MDRPGKAGGHLRQVGVGVGPGVVGRNLEVDPGPDRPEAAAQHRRRQAAVRRAQVDPEQVTGEEHLHSEHLGERRHEEPVVLGCPDRHAQMVVDIDAMGPFDILADPNKEAIKKYGVLWSPKEGVELASRQTFLIETIDPRTYQSSSQSS